MIHDNTMDDHVDDEVYKCLDLKSPKSFFLFAGAGSGKTRTLVNVLKKVKKNYSRELQLRRQKVAVITYTNNASDEIKYRLGNDSFFKVSTIHSYVWELIKYYNEDIKTWLRIRITEDIAELKEKQAKGREGTKASVDRERQIENKSEKLNNLNTIKQFTYNPNGDNNRRHSLNHSQVISIGAYFLIHKPLMQKIMVRTYPILLIDESQDTVKELVDAFFEVQKKCKKNFSLGLLGDTMQRIYSTGKEGLGTDLPIDWLTPSKKMNHRSSKRIVNLINNIRKVADKQKQRSRSDKDEGFVNLFLASSKIIDKSKLESRVAKKMEELTKDKQWYGEDSDIKTLTIEYHMVARRNDFLGLFEPLYGVDKLKTGLLDGTLSQLRLFTEYVLPLINAKKRGDEFTVSKIIRRHSPLLKKEFLKKEENQRKLLNQVNLAVKDLYTLWDKEVDPLIIDVLNKVYELNLFVIPESLFPIISRTLKEGSEIESAIEKVEDGDIVIDALDQAFSNPFSEIKAYHEYISGESKFETHQGVKGLEYPRVMVVLDDTEARGFMFNYDKLFGVKELSDTDKKNIKESKETSIDRTRRLFYVACSRAMESLAIVMYTDNVEVAKSNVIVNGWFKESEIEIINTI
jgi:DNA helicase-2/ATP-dependent DNA helicase PcrA